MSSQMVMLILLRVFGITSLLCACIFLPFSPGGYDKLAVTLSMMVQVGSFGSLLFVPIGILWLIFELRNPGKLSYGFGLASLIVSAVICILPFMAAFGTDNAVFGVIAILAALYFLHKTFSRLQNNRNIKSKSFNTTPFYLICIPIFVVLIRMIFIDKAIEFSRNHAIMKSENLISDIETFKNRNGIYPVSLLSLHKDYEPNVIGIEQYHYEPHLNAYNLFFEQMSSDLAVRKIVMYNKLDEHAMTSHDMDLLELSPADLNRQRGFFASRDLPQAHWKYFLFD